MMDLIRRFRPSGRSRAIGSVFSKASESRLPRVRRFALLVEPLERRELLATIQNFNVPGTGTPYTPQQFGAPPGPTVVAGAPAGNSVMELTDGTAPIPGQINQVAFDLSDSGTYNQVSATFDFEIIPSAAGRGNGLSFALLNTANFGTSGAAATPLAEKGLFKASLGIGFDTNQGAGDISNNFVVISFDSARLTEIPINPAVLDLASGIIITAQIGVNFTSSQVSVALTPAGGQTLSVVNNFLVAGLAPYQSRVAFTASAVTSQATMALDNVNVQFIGLRQTGTVSFSSTTYVVAENDPSGVATIDIVRNGGTAGSLTVNFVSADGTAKNGVNYTSIAGIVTFTEGGPNVIPVQIPIIDDHVQNGNKTVKLFIGNPTFAAPLIPPIQATLTILETDAASPTVSPRVQTVRVANTRLVSAFQLSFSQPMDPTTAQNVANYQVLLPPAHKKGPKRAVPLSQAVLDTSGTIVTLYRADLGRQHLTKFVQIVVRGVPPSGLRGTNGSFLAGTNGQGGTDAVLVVSV
jgi:hypothetical protein